MGKVATSPLPPRGSPPLLSGRQNQKWPIHGQGGYITPTASGIPTASERWAKSEVAHTWARWLHHPCRLGDPHRFKAGGKIRRSSNSSFRMNVCLLYFFVQEVGRATTTKVKTYRKETLVKHTGLKSKNSGALNA